MTEPGLAPLIGSVALLERAVGYALDSLLLVTPAAMGNRTPCPAWDLQALLGHLEESLTTLGEALGTGRLGLGPPPAADPVAADPVAAIGDRARLLLSAWSGALDHDLITVADCPVSTTV